MECSQVTKEAIPRETPNKFKFVWVICWIAVGTILCGVFLDMESKESKLDFRCDVTGDIVKDFIRDECYPQYLQSHKLGILPYAFMLVNMSLIPMVILIYSYHVESTVNRLERSHQDVEGEPRNQRLSRYLFIPYLFQLVTIALGITSIVLLVTHLPYPRSFPCSIKTPLSAKFSLNRTQSTNLFTCFHDRAGYKNFWTKSTIAANGIFAIFAFLEILWILWRARNGNIFMDNQKFYADHLKSSSDEQRQAKSEAITSLGSQYRAANIQREPGNAEITPSEHTELTQEQKDFQNAIHTLKENCLRLTEQPSDLKQPFGRPNPGEGYIHDLKMDEIYVNVAIHEGRPHHNFAKELNRWEQLKEYPLDAKDCLSTKPENVIDKEHTNVLVVGRPGIGKTLLSTNILRLWASGEAFNRDNHEKSAHFNVVFLVKFRRFNDYAELSLRELLVRAETVQSLDDPVWDFINKESAKVLLIFDGVGEYIRKEDIRAQEDNSTYKNDVEEKMPISVLYNKLAEGKLLRGASILTTTRPTAIEYIEHVGFKRIAEIRGFTLKNVEDYVEKFTRDVPGAKEKMWGQIKSNIKLISLCYIPMNCFLICHCLLQVLFESSHAPSTKITDIYKMTVKMFVRNHNREDFSPEKLEKLKLTRPFDPFENFREELPKIFKSLGEIAYKGIEEGRQLFKSSEVKGIEDCGLLDKLPDVQSKRRSLNDSPKFQFCFIHIVVQEFFAANHLVDTKTKKKIERFVRKHINDASWQVVLQFVAGLLKSSSSDIFIKLLPKKTRKKRNRLSSEREKLIFWPAKKDKELAVKVCKCLFEINDKQQAKLKKKIEKMNINTVNFSGCSLAPIDLAAVFHFLENAENVLNIDLSSSELEDLGAKNVKKFILNGECKLKWMNLSNNKFTDKVAEDFADALRHSYCQLKRLKLSGNKFTEEGRQYLTYAGKQSNCKVIV